LILTGILVIVPQEDTDGAKDGTRVQHNMDNLTWKTQYTCVCNVLKLKT